MLRLPRRGMAAAAIKGRFIMDGEAHVPDALTLHSRRAFLRTLAGVGGTLLLAACGGAAPSTSSTPSTAAATAPPATAPIAAPTTLPTVISIATAAPAPSATPAAALDTPKPGGTYRFMMPGDIPSMDVALAFDYIDWWASYLMVYNRLYSFDRNGHIFADLASELPQISEDKLTYTISLRKGVKFHNGRELTADDVKFSFDRVMDPKLVSPGASFNTNIVGADEAAAGKANSVSGVTVIDPYTVQFKLKQPQAVFPGVLGVSTNGIVPMKEVLEAGKDWGTKSVIGTGPFKVAEWRAGEALILERNTSFFRDPPYLDKIEIQLNVEDSVGVLRWENGGAEYAYSVPAAEIARIRSDEKLKDRIRTGPTLIFNYLEFRIAKPLDDVRVRQALAMAIDRKTLSERAQTALQSDSIYPSRLLQYDKDFTSMWGYNPEKAKQLLAEAGYPDGLKGVGIWTGTSRQGELIQADLKEIGVEAELVTGDYAQSLPRIDAGEIQIATRGYGSDFPDAGGFVTSRVVCPINPPPAKTLYCNKKIDDMAAQTDSFPLDSPERTALFRQIQQIAVNEDVAIIPLYERVGFGLGQPYVHDDAIHVLIGLPDIERMWMAKE